MRSIFIMLAITAICESAAARTITVSNDAQAEYRHIDQAIAEATSGDTIVVDEGQYGRGLIQIDKPLTLLGAGPEKTRRHSPAAVFAILAEDVLIEGFYLSGNSHGRRLATTVDCMDGSATLRNDIIDGSHYAVGAVSDARLQINFCNRSHPSEMPIIHCL